MVAAVLSDHCQADPLHTTKQAVHNMKDEVAETQQNGTRREHFPEDFPCSISAQTLSARPSKLTRLQEEDLITNNNATRDVDSLTLRTNSGAHAYGSRLRWEHLSESTLPHV